VDEKHCFTKRSGTCWLCGTIAGLVDPSAKPGLITCCAELVRRTTTTGVEIGAVEVGSPRFRVTAIGTNPYSMNVVS
jgi:hypothetical protein